MSFTSLTTAAITVSSVARLEQVLTDAPTRLVARIPIATYDELVGGVSPDSAFADGRSFSLCAVFEAQDGVSNVAVTERYDAVDEVPDEYLPPNPPLWFTELPEE